MKLKSFTIFGYQFLIDGNEDITIFWFKDYGVSRKELKKKSFLYKFFYFVFKSIK